jgi:hypothetical protein
MANRFPSGALQSPLADMQHKVYILIVEQFY